MRLLEAPPSGGVFSAWRAEPIPAGAVVSVIHHPRGDLKKWSQGNFNYDDVTSLNDFNLLAANFGQTATADDDEGEGTSV